MESCSAAAAAAATPTTASSEQPGPGVLAVVGCGRLGLTMALAFATKGFTVHGVDISPSLVSAIADRTFSSDEPGVTEALRAIPPDDQRLQATTDLLAAAAAADTMLICVDTPSTGGDRHYDHSKVGAVLSALNRYALKQEAEGDSSSGRIPRHVVVCCTVMPGYMLEVGAHLLRDSPQLRAGLLYNPLFIAQGEIMRGLLRPDLILIGEAGDRVEQSSGGHALVQIWDRVCDPPPSLSNAASHSKDLPIRRMSWTSAEITKLSLNCFVTMKIAFANMVGDVCDAAAARYASPDTVRLQQQQQQQQQQQAAADGVRSEIEADDLLNAALTVPALSEVCDKHAVLSAIGCDKRIGPLCLRPGYGFGGPCFPRDNRAFATVASGLGVEPLLPRATDEANSIHAATQARQFINLRASSYTFRDVAYKPGCPTPLIEESQKLRVAALLSDHIRLQAQEYVQPQGLGLMDKDTGGSVVLGNSKEISCSSRVIVSDRSAVLDAVRLSYGSRFSYEECD